MDELKLLVDMVANLPSMALWVIAAFWGYKVVVIGSVYGVIRLAIVKLHDWLTAKEAAKRVPVPMTLGANMINAETADALRAQMARLGGGGGYVHMSDVQRLKTALDALEVKKS